MEDWREQLISLLNLEDNWDTYGGYPPKQPVVQCAISFIEDLDVVPEWVGPLLDGGIMMDFVAENEIEVYLTSDCEFGYLFIPDHDNSSTWSEKDGLSHKEMLDFIIVNLNRKIRAA